MLLVFVSFSSEREAKSICETLVQERLCACASMHPVLSIYKWKGKLAKEKEWEAVLKTSGKKYARLEKRLRQLHSCELPQIIAVESSAGFGPYLKWVEG